MKKFALFFFVSTVSAATFQLTKGTARYEVRHLVKRVHAESTGVKGKIVCGEKVCEFLIAVPVKSFTSSDANRDENMFQTVEEGKFPLASASGTFALEDWRKNPTWTVASTVDFHGVKKTYPVKLEKRADGIFHAALTLKLSGHKVERPSLLTVKIDDDVPLSFELTWAESK